MSLSARLTTRKLTEYGKIRSDFPDNLNVSEGKTVKMEIESGGTLVQIETSWDIVLRKE